MKKNILIFSALLFLVVIMSVSMTHAQGFYWYPPPYYSFISYYYPPFEIVPPVRTAQIGLTTLLLLSALTAPTATTTVSPTIFPTLTPTVTTTPTIGTLTALLLGSSTSTLGTIPITTIPVI
jgi:hypothetical protein